MACAPVNIAADLLPPLLQDWVRLIGLPATMAMVNRYGGTRIYIPAEAPADHPYADLIGQDNLVKLCAEYGAFGHGLRLLLPNARRALTAVRNAQIRADYASKSARELAAAYQLNQRHIERIVADLDQVDTAQTALDF